jgi:hypothetical protein
MRPGLKKKSFRPWEDRSRRARVEAVIGNGPIGRDIDKTECGESIGVADHHGPG